MNLGDRTPGQNDDVDGVKTESDYRSLVNCNTMALDFVWGGEPCGAAVDPGVEADKVGEGQDVFRH